MARWTYILASMPTAESRRVEIELGRALGQQESEFLHELLRSDTLASAAIIREGWDAAHEVIGEYLTRRDHAEWRRALAIHAWRTESVTAIDCVTDDLVGWMQSKRSDFKRWALHRLDLQECLLLYDAIVHNASMTHAIDGVMLVGAICGGPSVDTRTFIHRGRGPTLAN